MRFDPHSVREFLRGPRGLAAAAAAALLVVLSILVFSGRAPGPWSLDNLPDLAATGDIPMLSEAMRTDSALRARVQKLGERDEAWMFTNYREVDSEVAGILLQWSGANMASAAKTAEGLDSRVDTFLRRIYGFNDSDFIVGEPIMGDKPWVRWFNHYKPRLLIQMAAQRVYDGEARYDPATDRMSVEPRLSRPFMRAFREFVAQQPQKAAYINNLLAFIDSTAGLAALPPKEREIIDELMALREKP